MHFPGGRAAEADAFLSERGIILRRMEGYGLPGALRLTVGDEEACRAVVSALKEFCEMTVMFERVALIGLGLIGSSLSHVMRREELAGHIAGYARK